MSNTILFHLYFYSLIRSDSVGEFNSYVNQTNLSKIKQSNNEIHSLIENAAFYESIQIIQYLKYNNVWLSFSLLSYSVHTNNADIINFLEGNDIKTEKKII